MLFGTRSKHASTGCDQYLLPVHLAGVVTSMCCNACRGVFMNYRSRLPYHPAYQVENAVNEGGGSLCYAISGLLCWFQVSPAPHQQHCLTCFTSRWVALRMMAATMCSWCSLSICSPYCPACKCVCVCSSVSCVHDLVCLLLQQY